MKKSPLVRLLFLGVLVAAGAFCAWYFRDKLEPALQWVRDLGYWGLVILGAAYLPSALVAFPPAFLLTIAAGAFYDIVPAVIAISLGSTLAATCAFLLGRTLARGWVEANVANRPVFKALDTAVADGGFKIVLKDADVLVVWGVPQLRDHLEGFNRPVVLVSHGVGGGAWAYRMIRSNESGATHFVAVSEAARLAFSPEVRDRVAVIYNGIDVERCTPSVPREQMRTRWGFTEKHRLIGYVGRYSWEKNPGNRSPDFPVRLYRCDNAYLT